VEATDVLRRGNLFKPAARRTGFMIYVRPPTFSFPLIGTLLLTLP